MTATDKATEKTDVDLVTTYVAGSAACARGYLSQGAGFAPSAVVRIDPNAFIIVQDAHQVLGDGFEHFDGRGHAASAHYLFLRNAP